MSYSDFQRGGSRTDHDQDVLETPRPGRVGRRALGRVPRRWGYVAAALVLVLAATIVAAVAGRSPAPAPRLSAPSQTPTQRANPASLEHWVNSLAAGANVEPPFLVVDAATATGEQLILVGPAVRLVLDGHVAAPGAPLATYVGRTRDAALVLARTRGSPALTRLLRIDLATSATSPPRVTVLADGVDGVALSPDLHEVAVGMVASADRSAGIAVLDARTGRLLNGYTDPDLAAERVVGWSGGRVVAERSSAAESRVLVWTPGGTVEDLGVLPGGHAARLEVAAGLPGRVLVSRPGQAGESCGAVLPLDDLARSLAHGCYRAAPVSLAPDGRHALLSDLSVLDLSSGRVAGPAAPDGVAAQDPAWEDDAHVVAVVRWETPVDSEAGYFTTVRCDAAGRCELPRLPGPGGPDSLDVPLP